MLKETQINVNQSLRERHYWTSNLSLDVVRGSFPYDYRREYDTLCKFQEVKFNFSDEIDSKLISISNGSDLRLHMILVAGVAAVLSKTMDVEDIILGTSIYKQDEEREFINTLLPLKTNVSKEMSFKELIIEIRRVIMEATENQNYPINRLLKELQVEEADKQVSLFDVAVILENVQDKKFLEQTHSNIIFAFNRKDKCIEGMLQYNSLLYDARNINGIMDKLKLLFTQVVRDLNTHICSIELLSEEEKERLLSEFNNTITNNNNVPETIYELFQEQASKNPDNIAVVYENNKVTYRELNERANGLANILVKKGVKAETLIGIVSEPSIEMIIGIMAIIKAGGAYVPIDAEYPRERIEYMIKDSNINIVLAKNDISSDFGYKGDIIYLDSECINDNLSTNLEKTSNGCNAAYVIYTSGSTGKPKGVVVEHNSIINSLLWRKNYFNFSEKTSILQTSSFSFDTSVLSMFTALISGAKLVLINQYDLFSHANLKNAIINNKVTDFSIIPNIYRLILKNDSEILKDVKNITLVGENFNELLVKEHFIKLENVKLYNEYGPAENSVCTTLHEFKQDKTEVLIGRPIDNVRCYILDKSGELLPIGAKGELCICGRGLARGYLNNKVLTEEKFVNCNLLAGERMYKTGDIAKWTQDGSLEFIGRTDDLVKINGCRIELGEIESQLLKNDSIKDALVIEKKYDNGSSYICAYIVFEDGNEGIEDDKLRKYLENKLPQYMIPRFFVEMERIPRTLSGKIDKKYLVDPINKTIESEYVAPQNEIEERLCKIYEKALNISKVGIKDNYFHIGGDSIKSISLVSLINEEMNINLEVSDIYQNQTIQELALKVMNYSENIENKEVEYNDVLKEMNELRELVLKGE